MVALSMLYTAALVTTTPTIPCIFYPPLIIHGHHIVHVLHLIHLIPHIRSQISEWCRSAAEEATHSSTGWEASGEVCVMWLGLL